MFADISRSNQNTYFTDSNQKLDTESLEWKHNFFVAHLKKIVMAVISHVLITLYDVVLTVKDNCCLYILNATFNLCQALFKFRAGPPLTETVNLGDNIVLDCFSRQFIALVGIVIP